MLAAVLCVFMIAGLCGCRFSPKLQEVIYESLDAPIDFSNEAKTIQNTDQAEETTEDFTYQKKTDEAEREISKEKDIAYESDRAGRLEAGKNTASEKGVRARLQDALKGQSVDPDSILSNDTGTKSASGVPDDSADNGNTVRQSDASNEDVNRHVDDGYGESMQIPENVRRIAALGEMASVVRMLGGEGSVIASDAAFVNNTAAGKIWSDIASVPVLMTGNQYMDDGSFEELLALQPEAVIENDGNLYLTDDQIGRLQQAGIPYVALSDFSSPEAIREIVRITGSMIGTPEAEQLADDYDSWAAAEQKKVNRALSSVQTYGKYTLFLGAWDDTARYAITANGYTAMSGTGAAVTYLGYLGNVINTFTSAGGVVNTPSMYSVSQNTSVQYALPIVPLLHSTQASGSMADTYCALDIFRINGEGLGSSSLPAVIAADPQIRDKIAQSAMWKVYGIVDSSDQHFYGRGFLDQSGIIVNSDITGNYEVFVNPKGLGSWWRGSAESVMEPLWIASVFYGVPDISQVENDLKSFYSTFYGYTLSGEEVSAIMQGYGL